MFTNYKTNSLQDANKINARLATMDAAYDRFAAGDCIPGQGSEGERGLWLDGFQDAYMELRAELAELDTATAVIVTE